MFKLVRSETPTNSIPSERHQWPVQMSVTYTEDDEPASVFVMRAALPGEFGSASFSCVASVQQMDDLPIGEVGPDSPFYRVDTITVLARSSGAAAEFVEKVKSVLQDLADNIAASEILSVVEETIITPDV